MQILKTWQKKKTFENEKDQLSHTFWITATPHASIQDEDRGHRSQRGMGAVPRNINLIGMTSQTETGI